MSNRSDRSDKSDRSDGKKRRTGPARLAAGVCLAVLFAVPAQAGFVVGYQDWDTDPAAGVGNWDDQRNVATVSENTGGADHWLQVDFPVDGAGPGDEFDIISVPAQDLFAGTWENNLSVDFDFFAATVEPRRVQVRFADTNASSRVWRYEVFNSDTDSMALNTWTGFHARMWNWEEWRVFSPAYTSSTFLQDLQNIDWIGIYIYRGSTGAETYGIDNFMLIIPEPSEYVMLAAAAVVVWLTLRRRQRQAGWVPARLA